MDVVGSFVGGWTGSQFAFLSPFSSLHANCFIYISSQKNILVWWKNNHLKPWYIKVWNHKPSYENREGGVLLCFEHTTYTEYHIHRPSTTCWPSTFENRPNCSTSSEQSQSGNWHNMTYHTTAKKHQKQPQENKHNSTKVMQHTSSL